MAGMESGVDKATKRRGRLQGCLSPFIVPEKVANRRLGGSQQREGTDRKVEASEGNTMGATESEIVCTRQGRIAELAGQEMPEQVTFVAFSPEARAAYERELASG